MEESGDVYLQPVTPQGSKHDKQEPEEDEDEDYITEALESKAGFSLILHVPSIEHGRTQQLHPNSMGLQLRPQYKSSQVRLFTNITEINALDGSDNNDGMIWKIDKRDKRAREQEAGRELDKDEEDSGDMLFVDEILENRFAFRNMILVVSGLHQHNVNILNEIELDVNSCVTVVLKNPLVEKETQYSDSDYNANEDDMVNEEETISLVFECISQYEAKIFYFMLKALFVHYNPHISVKKKIKLMKSMNASASGYSSADSDSVSSASSNSLGGGGGGVVVDSINAGGNGMVKLPPPPTTSSANPPRSQSRFEPTQQVISALSKISSSASSSVSSSSSSSSSLSSSSDSDSFDSIEDEHITTRQAFDFGDEAMDGFIPSTFIDDNFELRTFIHDTASKQQQQQPTPLTASNDVNADMHSSDGSSIGITTIRNSPHHHQDKQHEMKFDGEEEQYQNDETNYDVNNKENMRRESRNSRNSRKSRGSYISSSSSRSGVNRRSSERRHRNSHSSSSSSADKLDTSSRSSNRRYSTGAQLAASIGVDLDDNFLNEVAQAMEEGNCYEEEKKRRKEKRKKIMRRKRKRDPADYLLCGM
jgi:hypothetical protein